MYMNSYTLDMYINRLKFVTANNSKPSKQCEVRMTDNERSELYNKLRTVGPIIYNAELHKVN